MESRSGGAPDGRGRRNSDYFPALTLLLERLAAADAVLTDAFVDSSATGDLPVDKRRLHLPVADYPLRLAGVRDIEGLRVDLCRAQRPVGQRPGVRGGNNHKRVRLVLAPPGRDLDQLASALVRGADSQLDSEAATAEELFTPRCQGFVSSAARRRAIEQHAVERVTTDLTDDSWDVDDVGMYRPFDLLCTRGGEELRVEVKGTTGEGTEVILTAGEVRHAEEHSSAVALAVVSQIRVGDDFECHGGTLRWLRPWRPRHDALAPIAYKYLLADWVERS